MTHLEQPRLGREGALVGKLCWTLLVCTAFFPKESELTATEHLRQSVRTKTLAKYYSPKQNTDQLIFLLCVCETQMPSCPRSLEAALAKTSNSWVRAALTLQDMFQFLGLQSVAPIGQRRRTRPLPVGLLARDTVTLTEWTRGEEWKVWRLPSKWQQHCIQTLCDTVSSTVEGGMKKIRWFMLTVSFCSNGTAGVGSYWMIHGTGKVLHCFVFHRWLFYSLWLPQTNPKNFRHSRQQQHMLSKQQCHHRKFTRPQRITKYATHK